MTGREAVAVWSAIVLSVGLNAILALAPEHASSRTPADSSSRCAQAGAAAAPRRTGVAPHPDADCRHRLVGCRELKDGCAEALSDCQYDLAVAQPPHKRFEKGRRSPENEARFGAYVEAVLAPFEGLETALECRDDICRLDLRGENLDGFGSPAFTLGTDHRRHNLIEGYGAGGAPPVGDEAERLVFHFDLHEPGTTSGSEVLTSLVGAFLATDALAECHARYPAAGELRVQLRVAPGVGITVVVGGDLGAHPAGLCVAERLRDLAERTDVPNRTSAAATYRTWQLPPA